MDESKNVVSVQIPKRSFSDQLLCINHSTFCMHLINMGNAKIFSGLNRDNVCFATNAFRKNLTKKGFFN